jgi:hypothetical protein
MNSRRLKFAENSERIRMQRIHTEFYREISWNIYIWRTQKEV